MMLAGVPVPDRLVIQIAQKLRDAGHDDTAERLETAYDQETKVLALSISARDNILQVVVDCPTDWASSERPCCSSKSGEYAKELAERRTAGRARGGTRGQTRPAQLLLRDSSASTRLDKEPSRA